MSRKKWPDLTVAQQTFVYLAGAVEGVATAAALRDLAVQVRGPKAA